MARAGSVRRPWSPGSNSPPRLIHEASYADVACVRGGRLPIFIAATGKKEGASRDFVQPEKAFISSNRRQVAAYGGLAPSPWQSGGFERDQGISKSDNRRLRKTMIEVAWLWLRHQPDSALSRWFQTRVGAAKGRIRRIAIVALARKLLVALWRYVTQGVVPEGAVFKAA